MKKMKKKILMNLKSNGLNGPIDSKPPSFREIIKLDITQKYRN